MQPIEVQNVVFNDARAGAGVEITYKWAHSRRVYSHGLRDLVVFVLEKRYLAKLQECQDVLVLFVRRLLFSTLGM